ncbi:hypothetical protein [Microvirga lenta]|uniref:hypothetical protein n=1 Tax=Microvirga lenta TaxID=2881337 RepID=UPI001CFEA183|nr:hypothetical protein [Microvirga lenta]
MASIRSQPMLNVGKPHVVIAFPGGRGTADIVRQAKAAGIKVPEAPPLSLSQGAKELEDERSRTAYSQAVDS